MHRASKNNQQEPGRTRGARSLAYANEVESGAAPARAFKALPNLLHVHRLLPGRHHQRLGSRPSALRPRVGSIGGYRIRYELYSGGIKGVGQRTEHRGQAQVRFSLTWSHVSQGRRAVASRGDGRNVMWLRLAPV